MWSGGVEDESEGEKATSSSWRSLACSPASKLYRTTVFLFTPTSRLVLRTPQPSTMWAKTEAISGSGKRAPNSGVPLRSENRALHVEQYNMRRCLLGP